MCNSDLKARLTDIARYQRVALHTNASKIRNYYVFKNIRAVYTRENKPRLTLAAAYIRREHPV